ncbi:MAG: hypothetical protein OHK0012_20540 [Synechococcales cyanobacterium]
MRTVPFWLFWVVPFILQTGVAVGLVAVVSIRNGQLAVRDLTQQLLSKTIQRVHDHLDTYLAAPRQITTLNQLALSSGSLSLEDRRVAEHYFWRQAQAFPHLAYVGLALTDGREVGAGRWVVGEDVLIYEKNAAQTLASDYRADAQGNRQERIQQYAYDSRQDDSYQKAVQAGGFVWSDTYAEDNGDPGVESEPYVGITAAAPFYDDQGRLLGVVSTDILLSQLSQYLRDIQVSPGGQVLIIEAESDALVASSTNTPILHRRQDDYIRYTYTDSPDPLVQGLAPYLAAPQISETIPIQQERYFVKTRLWQEPHGLSWRVVVVIPEADVMGRIQDNTRQTVVLCLLALGVTLVVGSATARWITRPMATLYQASQNMAAGQMNTTIPPTVIQELHAVGESFNGMASQLQASFSQLHYAATHDMLTGLCNRAAFHEHVQRVMERDPETIHCAILVLDLDNFKVVNDTLGHLAGDQLITCVSQRLQHCVRAHDTLARFGGDEFVILLEPIGDPQEAVRIARRILDRLKEPFILQDTPTYTSVSIGIAVYNPASDDAESLLRRADFALYEAKAQGKGGYVVHG